MATYAYKTESGVCEAKNQNSELALENCQGRFEINKSMKDASKKESCRFCGCKLKRDLQAEGAPAAKFVGDGFYSTDYKNK